MYLLKTKRFIFGFIILSYNFSHTQNNFTSSWPSSVTRTWAGPEYWTNPMQAWRINNGRLESIESRVNQNTHLLTHQISEQSGTLSISITMGHTQGNSAWAGFRLGIKAHVNEYRFNAIWGNGIDMGMRSTGELFIKGTNGQSVSSPLVTSGVELRLNVAPSGNDYTITLTAHNATGDEVARVSQGNIANDELIGNLALVSDAGQFWFESWQVNGTKLEVDVNHKWGPVLWAQYTLTTGVLKLLAFVAPMGASDETQIALQIRKKGSMVWDPKTSVAKDPLSHTALFRIESWDGSQDWEYRVSYNIDVGEGKKEYEWLGEIRKEPIDKDEFVVAGFTGHKDYGFPNREITDNVAKHNPDLLFFSGDQLYEGNGGFGIVRNPIEKSSLDYLRKFYLLGWSFGNLMRNRPTVMLPDDHDVYQGNIWGHGGRNTSTDVNGGYIMNAQWVNMVQRTQTAHLPDPFDPTPIDQNMGVYYTHLNYGGVSFAIIEDRKWKSGPNSLPIFKDGGRVDHINYPTPAGWDPTAADVSGAVLLGDRQLTFLDSWAQNWESTYLKVVLSATIFSQVTSMHGGANSRLTADFDSNGWPQTGRNKALTSIRKGFGFMLAGDTHLPTIIHHGVDDWRDGGFSFSVPSIGAGYPRGWIPMEDEKAPGWSALPNRAPHTGDFIEGFGNKVTVWAAANPAVYYNNNQMVNNAGNIAVLEEKNSGYGIVTLNKFTRKINMEAFFVTSGPGDRQMEDWPLEIDMEDNYGKQPIAYLPTLKISNMIDPVVQIINQLTGEIVYTLRIIGNEYKPKVFDNGPFTIKIGKLGTAQEVVLQGIQPDGLTGTATLDVVVPVSPRIKQQGQTLKWKYSDKNIFIELYKKQIYHLTLFSIRGEEILNYNLKGPGIFKESISLLNPGVFFLNIKSKQGLVSKKIFILD